MSRNVVPLPVDELLGQVTTSLKSAPALVLRSPTGSGKTTRVPPALERAGFGAVLLVEPRRVAARGAARRMAFERGEEVGRSVGYHVRFDKRVSSQTRICALTEGLFLRRVLADPFLEGIGCVVFDEFHERHLDGDLGLALARRVQMEACPDLKIVVLSATIDPGPLVAFLDALVIDAPGKLFPVEVAYQAARGREPLEGQVVRGVVAAREWIHERRQTPSEGMLVPGSDVLVFLPGKGEIRRAEQALGQRGILTESLHGELDAKSQDRVLVARSNQGAGRVILSTNIAESSVTIEGLGAVIDSGQARIMRFDSRVGLDRLELTQISMPSVLQRMGRAGRCGPGFNLRLWSPLVERTFSSGVEPEIVRVDLAQVLLSLSDFGERDLDQFAWFERPPSDAVSLGRELLTSIGAIDEGGITVHGRELARLPVHPRLGQLLMAGKRHGVLERAALAAALLSERDALRGVLERFEQERVHGSDLLERLEIVEGSSHVRAPKHVRLELLRVRDLLLRSMTRSAHDGAAKDLDGALLRAVFEAFPDRIAVRRRTSTEQRVQSRRGRRVAGAGGGSVRARMIGGRGLTLGDECRVREAELFVALEVGGQVRGSNEAFVRIASGVERAWLEQMEPIEEGVVCAVDEDSGRVRPKRVRSWRGLVLDELPVSDVGANDLARAREVALVDFARRKPCVAFAVDHDECNGLKARVSFAHKHAEGDWLAALPAFDAKEFALLHVEELVSGTKSLADLAAYKLWNLYLEWLDYPVRQSFDLVVPIRLRLPNGEGVRIQYETKRGPVLRVRIQQMFGWQVTPKVSGVPVLLELCAPNGRPQQTTSDLAGFWAGSYALVRKDLRGRYPKHEWPEDPAAAPPIPPRKRQK